MNAECGCLVVTEKVHVPSCRFYDGDDPDYVIEALADAGWTLARSATPSSKEAENVYDDPARWGERFDTAEEALFAAYCTGFRQAASFSGDLSSTEMLARGREYVRTHATPDNAGRSSIEKEAASADAGGSLDDVERLRAIEVAARDYVTAERRWLRAGYPPGLGRDADRAAAILRAALGIDARLSESTGSEGPR